MNKMNRKVEYALMALKVMSGKGQGKLTTAKEVVEVTGCPFDATARVMQQMSSQGLLKSEQGAHGGYQIMRDLSKVSVHDLVEIVLGETHIVKCLHEEEEGACELVKKCNMQSPLTELDRKIKEFYRSVSLKEVLRVRDHGVRP